MLATMFGMGVTSCDKSGADPDEPAKKVEAKLKTIKIVNAGENGDKTVDGTIDESMMTITFPRISSKSNFAAIKFEITASEGAKLEQETYDFSMTKEETEKEVIIKVVNGSKYTEYMCTVGRIAPLFGADFAKAKEHALEGTATKLEDHRWSSFDGKVAALSGKAGISVVSIADILADKPGFKLLDLSACSGGIFPVDCCQTHDGHIYACNLANGGELKVYYWENADAQAETLFSLPIEKTFRLGDNMSMDLDEKGNGFIFLQSNNGGAFTQNIVRLTVKNGKEVSDPQFLDVQFKNQYSYDTITKLDGSDFYAYSGSGCLQTICDNMMSTQFEFPNAPDFAELNSLRIVNFNQERYLVGITVGRNIKVMESAILRVYNITKGEDVKTALEEFFALEERKPVYEVVVGGNHGGLAFANADYYIEKDAKGNDAKLYLFGSAKTDGMKVIEIPIKKAEGEE